MNYENAPLAQCLEQIDLLAFKDEHGHPLRNSEAFIRLVELAERGAPYIATTFENNDQYRSAYSLNAAQPRDNYQPLAGPVVLGKFTGKRTDIEKFLASKRVGELCVNTEKDLRQVIHVTPEMAQKEWDRVLRIKALKEELASLEK